MPKSADVPTELRDFSKVFDQLMYRHEPSRVFSDYLMYVIQGHTYAPGYPLGTVPREHDNDPDYWDRWKKTYDDKEQKAFYSLYVEHVRVMDKMVCADNDWYDPLGIFYECMASSGHRSNMGQFFTPSTLCDAMTKIIYNPEEVGAGKYVSDPTCGSGRTLLSFNSHCPGNVMLAEDLDSTCVKMTVVNFLFHGCRGEVIHHDSLDPDSWFSGYLVNVNLKPGPFGLPIPHVCRLEKEKSLIWNKWQLRKQEVAEERAKNANTLFVDLEAKPKPSKKQAEPKVEIIDPKDINQQLTLF